MVANLCRQGGRKLQVRAANMMRWAAGRRTFAQRLRGWLDSPLDEVGRVNSFNCSPLSGVKSRSPSPFGHRLLPEGPRGSAAGRIRSVLHHPSLRGRPIRIADANADLEKWPLQGTTYRSSDAFPTDLHRCIGASVHHPQSKLGTALKLASLRLKPLKNRFVGIGVDGTTVERPVGPTQGTPLRMKPHDP